MNNLLVELFVEELPPKSLKALGEAFAHGVFEALRSRRFLLPESASTAFATPRRLAVHVSSVLGESPPSELLQRWLPLSVALDAAGRPSAAFRKRGEKAGRGALVDAWPNAEDGPDRLYAAAEGHGEFIFFRTLAAGQTLARGLSEALDEAIEALPIAKLMSYPRADGDGWDVAQFVRPAHGLVALHGDEVVDAQALGLNAGRATRGHRFEGSGAPIRLRHADGYAQQLRDEGRVIAGYSQRRAEIVRQLQQATSGQGLSAIDDEALLDEVTGLLEWPNVLCCTFDAGFLAVPPECLILTMKANQKYFALLDGRGKLTNRFLVVSNTAPADPSRIVEGNQRVVRARLADAKFFFDQDRKKTLESRLPGLDRVVYHGKLGSQGERVQRVRTIARAIGQQLGGPELAAAAARAALLAKADLLTDMVGEFPELQGTMGGCYARHDGESEEVAVAIEDHYRPRFSGDTLPRNRCGEVLALADKLETLAGLFGIGQLPSGDKDPFALRRHAIGVIRLLLERQLPLPLDALLELAFGAFAPGLLAPSKADLRAFIGERLAGMLREQGYSAQQVDAVLARNSQAIERLPRQLAAVQDFAALPEAASLAAANKRITNILAKSGAEPSAAVDAGLFSQAAERQLHAALKQVGPLADACYERGDYAASLRELAALKAPVDAFFDQVMVNAEDPALRANRLALLSALHTAMNRVAELSKLAA